MAPSPARPAQCYRAQQAAITIPSPAPVVVWLQWQWSVPSLVSLWSQCPSVEHPAPASSPLMSDAVASSRLTSSASASSSEQAEQVTSAQGDSAKLHQYAQGLYFVQK